MIIRDGVDGADGLDGTSCTVTDNDDGTATISCEDGTSVTLGDPRLTVSPTRIALGEDFSCARLETGHVRCWGENQYAN